MPESNKIEKQSLYPNLLIIGSMKSGTTSLHHYLNEHPDIFMSPNKEPNYFCEDREEETTNWYLNLFQGSEGFAYRGESSIGYSKGHEFKGVPERIFTRSPQAKLIYVVRKPIDRMVSEFKYLKWRGEIAKQVKIDDYFKDFENSIIQTSNYFFQLNKFLEVFPKEQILVLKFEELKNQPKEVLQKVANFLTISDFPDRLELKKYNVSAQKIKPKRWMLPINKVLHRYVQGNNLSKYKSKLKQTWIIRRIGYTDDFLEEKLDPNLAEEIQAYLKHDLTEFGKISGVYF